MDSSSPYKDLVEYIVKSIVDNPDSVHITEIVHESSVTLEVQVADGDMGRVIGRGGSVVNSIRSLLQVLAAKKGMRVSLEIV
jgi:predicted RNA-binding protein YlqC (UPF0109 family)